MRLHLRAEQPEATFKTRQAQHPSHFTAGAGSQVPCPQDLGVYGAEIFIACGKTGSGFTAAINQLAFGSAPGLGAGDACGRCFALTGTADPFSPAYTGPFHSIVVKVTDLWYAVSLVLYKS